MLCCPLEGHRPLQEQMCCDVGLARMQASVVGLNAGMQIHSPTVFQHPLHAGRGGLRGSFGPEFQIHPLANHSKGLMCRRSPATVVLSVCPSARQMM